MIPRRRPERMELNKTLIIMKKEARESLKNRWFILYTVCFAGLAMLLFVMSPSGGGLYATGGFARTTAAIVNLVLFFVPLISLVTGAMSIAGERENGTLPFLLSHPVSRLEVFFGKFAGLTVTIWVSIGLGFGISGVVIALKGGGMADAAGYMATAGLSALLAVSLVSVGLIVSVFSRATARAVGTAVFLWLGFIVVGDLGIMGTTVAMDLGIKPVFFMALANPAEVFKIAAVIALSTRFEMLGPVGVYALRTFGSSGAFALLVGVLVLWTVIPLSVGAFLFNKMDKDV